MKDKILFRVETQHATAPAIIGHRTYVLDVPCPAEGCDGTVRYDGPLGADGELRGIPCDRCGRTYAIQVDDPASEEEA